MGSSISHRPGKCLKSRRAKSEEYLGPKQQHHQQQNNIRDNMGRFFVPWRNIINEEDITDNNRANSNVTKYFNYSDWIRKDMSANMEKSFNEIHRSNSMDKSTLEMDYERLIMDKYAAAADCIRQMEEESVSGGGGYYKRITIDADKGESVRVWAFYTIVSQHFFFFRDRLSFGINLIGICEYN